MTSDSAVDSPATPRDASPSTEPVRIVASTIVLDLEGTTSAAGFILGDLYDYARPRLLPWIQDHADDPAIAEARDQVIEEADLLEIATDEDIEAALIGFMAADVKSTPLKTIQGQIWAEGFARGEISSHFFEDVIPRLRAWHEAGISLAVFSSGSVASQVPWFRHSPDGDLTPLITDYFDTVKAGPKKVATSYDRIADSLGADPSSLVFFTDNPEEIDAAVEAGWQVVAFARPGEPFFDADFGDALVVDSFDAIDVTPDAVEDMLDSDDEDPEPEGPVAAPVPVFEEPGSDAVHSAGEALAAESARYAGMGWMRGTSGNLSVVLNRDPLRLAVTASGLDKGDLTAADVVVVDADGEPVGAGRGKRPSAEAGLHARIAAVTGANAVVHLHALSAVIAGHHWPNGVELRDLEMLKGLGHDAHGETVVIPVIPNGQDMREQGDAFERAYLPPTLRDNEVPVLIIASHGMYAWGETLTQARWHAELAEWLLRFTVETVSPR